MFLPSRSKDCCAIADDKRLIPHAKWRVRMCVLAAVATVRTLAVSPAAAQAAASGKPVFGIPVDFILFALTLIGVALLAS